MPIFNLKGESAKQAAWLRGVTEWAAVLAWDSDSCMYLVERGEERQGPSKVIR